VTGKLPFEKCSALECFMKKMGNDIKPPRELVPELSERVDWAIRRAMSPNPESRPGSCREFVEDLYGKSVRPTGSSSTNTPAPDEADLWYLVYRDENGASHTVKGGTEGIRKALREGLLGDASNMVACRHHKQGPFLDLRSFPEFRDLLIAPEPLPSPSLTPTRTPIRTPIPPSGRWPTPSDTPTANLGAMPAGGRYGGSGSLSGRMASPSGRLAAPSARHLKPPDSSKIAPSPDASSRLPHLPVALTRRSRGFDVLMWLGVLVVAVATALAMFHFFPLK
jgi:hypothetical protein